jgi:hypothetical protein
VAEGTEAERLQAFRSVREAIESRIREWVATLPKRVESNVATYRSSL